MSILVIGDIMLDRYIIGHVNRISPEAPVPIVNVSNEDNRLGGSNNVANNLASLGADSYSFGVIGNDNNAEIVIDLMNKSGIKNLLIEDSKIPTITKIRIVAHNQQIVRLDYEKPITDRGRILKEIKNLLNNHAFDLIIISDYNKGVCFTELCEYVANFAKIKKVKLIVDPKGNNWEKYNGSWLITPNLKELQDILGRTLNNNDADIEDGALQVIEKYKIENVLITRSEKGMSIITKEKQIEHFHSVAKDVFDVSGAGDTVVAVIASCILDGKSLRESIRIANLAAGYVVSQFGTYAISKKELSNELTKNCI